MIFNRKYNQSVMSYTYSKQKTSTVSITLTRLPSSLLFMSEGGDTNRPSQFKLAPKGSLSVIPADEGNYTLPDIPELDRTFIISIIFSLYVILLGYDAISGEREQGTLRLILSNPIGRIKQLHRTCHGYPRQRCSGTPRKISRKPAQAGKNSLCGIYRHIPHCMTATL